MIAIPKPHFVPIGKSVKDKRIDIIEMQGHILNDAIDRVSCRRIIPIQYLY